jgi:uncharacterized membrane protein
MANSRDSAWVGAGRHLRRRLVTGLLVLVPIGITILVLRFLFNLTASVLAPAVRLIPGKLPKSVLALISVCAFLLLLYAVGAVAQLLVGRRLIAIAEALVARIPLVKSVYSAVKQVVDTLSPSRREAFKSVVWVEFPRPGFRALAFVTGNIRDADGTECYKLFIPTAPNPTSGFFEIAPCAEVRESALSIEDGIKMILSAGILAPDTLEPECGDPGEEKETQGE